MAEKLASNSFVPALARVIRAAVLILLTSCAEEHEQAVPLVRIVGYGIFEHAGVAMRPDETSIVGAKRGSAQRLRIATQTDQIPVRPGLGYGIAFVVNGAGSEVVRIRVVLRSSSPCKLKTSGELVYLSDTVLTVEAGQLRHIGGRFPASEEEDHCVGEQQPGTDTLALYIGYRKLAEKTFHLYRE